MVQMSGLLSYSSWKSTYPICHKMAVSARRFLTAFILHMAGAFRNTPFVVFLLLMAFQYPGSSAYTFHMACTLHNYFPAAFYIACESHLAMILLFILQVVQTCWILLLLFLQCIIYLPYIILFVLFSHEMWFALCASLSLDFFTE